MRGCQRSHFLNVENVTRDALRVPHFVIICRADGDVGLGHAGMAEPNIAICATYDYKMRNSQSISRDILDIKEVATLTTAH